MRIYGLRRNYKFLLLLDISFYYDPYRSNGLNTWFADNFTTFGFTVLENLKNAKSHKHKYFTNENQKYQL